MRRPEFPAAPGVATGGQAGKPSRATGDASAARKAERNRSKKTARRKAAKREPIDTGTNKLYIRRSRRSTSFKNVEDVVRSPAQDRRRKTKMVAKRGQGERGDRRR
jgi:hypothetical protein